MRSCDRVRRCLRQIAVEVVAVGGGAPVGVGFAGLPAERVPLGGENVVVGIGRFRTVAAGGVVAVAGDGDAAPRALATSGSKVEVVSPHPSRSCEVAFPFRRVRSPAGGRRR